MLQIHQFLLVMAILIEKERLLDIIKNFICFSNDGENIIKILAAYHQYFAVRKAITSTKKAVA